MKSSSNAPGHVTVKLGRCAPALACAAAIALLAGCKNEQKASPTSEPAQATQAQSAPTAAPAMPSAHAPAKAKGDAVTWEDPKGWEKKPGGGMRHSTYTVPAAAGDKETGELVVFYFPPPAGGGDVESNITRWVGQMQGADPKDIKRTDRTVNDIPQHIVEVPKGTYDKGASAMAKEEKVENYGLLGAIIVAPDASKYFYKLTGPANTVKAARDQFFALLDSIKPKAN